MSPFVSLVSSVDPRPDARLSERAQLSQIDASVCGPAVLFVVSGLNWLLGGLLVGLLASVKLWLPVMPGFLGILDHVSLLTYGRLVPAFENMLTYGWGCNMVFAVGLWIMARLCGTQVKHLGMLYVAGGVWNFGVLWGVAWILFGDSTSVQGLEMPVGVAPVLLSSYLLIALWAILCFHYRQPGPVYVSQWYLLAAFFWFPWIYFVGELMVLWVPARGTVQALANGWFTQNAYALWFTPAALAAIYYLLPKVLGRPIRHYYLSALGFVILAAFSPWTGAVNLIYGPVPVWTQTVSIVASVVLILPLLVTAINFHLTAWDGARDVWRSPTLRFVVFGALSFTVAGAIGVWTSLRSVNVVTHFTQFAVAHEAHAFYAFFTMTMFGAIYFMLPRLLQRNWPSALLIEAHFWLSALGVGMLLTVLYLGGWTQGAEMNDASVPFIEVVKHLQVMNELRTLAGLVMLAGLGAFLANVGLLVASGVISLACELLMLDPTAPAQEGSR
jgi:cytochrome c oxidase cbb3-type subunit 1